MTTYANFKNSSLPCPFLAQRRESHVKTLTPSTNRNMTNTAIHVWY